MNTEAYDNALFLLRLNRALIDAGVEALTEIQRMFLAVDIFNTAAMNDGLGHFFYYDGHLYESAVRGLELIGLPLIAGRLRTFAESVFGSKYPMDSAIRQRVLSEGEDQSEAAEAAFGKYLYIEPVVTEALIKWANTNRDAFAGLYRF
jgi:hypothetical protein